MEEDSGNPSVERAISVKSAIVTIVFQKSLCTKTTNEINKSTNISARLFELFPVFLRIPLVFKPFTK